MLSIVWFLPMPKRKGGYQGSHYLIRAGAYGARTRNLCRDRAALLPVELRLLQPRASYSSRAIDGKFFHPLGI